MSDPIYRNEGQTHGDVPEWGPGQIDVAVASGPDREGPMWPWPVNRTGSSKQMNQNDYGLKECKHYFYGKADVGTEG